MKKKKIIIIIIILKKQDENGKILAERPPQKIMKLLTLELPKGEFDVETSLICPTKCWRCDHSNESSGRVHCTCAVCAITGEFIFLHFSFGQTNIAVRVNVKRGRLYYFSNNSKHGSCQSISIPPSLEGSLWTFHLFQPANPSCRKLSDSFKPIQATDARDQSLSARPISIRKAQ